MVVTGTIIDMFFSKLQVQREKLPAMLFSFSGRINAGHISAIVHFTLFNEFSKAASVSSQGKEKSQDPVEGRTATVSGAGAVRMGG